MISIFRKIKEENISFEDFSNQEKAVLITSLMIECAKSDGLFSENEEILIKNILRNKLHLDEDEANKCLNESKNNSNESVEIYSLTKDIRENFSKEEILLIFEYLWQIILADDIVDDFEASMMTKLTGLFHLTGQENAVARQNAKDAKTSVG